MSRDLLRLWRAGTPPEKLTEIEAAVLAEHLMTRGAAVYRDPKHPDHAGLSAEIRALHQRASPGYVGPGGEMIGGEPPSESLFR